MRHKPYRFSPGVSAAKTSTPPLIAQLGPQHRGHIRRHLLELSAADRYLRFGYAISDEQLAAYARHLHFSRDAAFGAFDDGGAMLGFGHLAFDRSDGTAEFGVSVASHAQRLGIGRSLLTRAAQHARNRGYSLLLMVFLPENQALVSLARSAQMQLTQDQVEPRAYLALEAPDGQSVLEEAWNEAIASIDLGFRRAVAGARATSV